MKIAYLTAMDIHHHGGTEKCGAWLVEDLARGNQVSVFANRVEDVAAGNLEIERVPVVPRPALLRYLSFLVIGSLMLAWRILRGGKFDIIHATGADSPFANVITAHFCQGRWLELRQSGAVSMPLRTLGQKLKYYLLHQPYSYLVTFLERRIFAGTRVKRIVAVSEGLKRDLVRCYRLPPERIVVIPNAVDERVFLSTEEKATRREMIRQRHGLLPDDVVLLFVAAGDWQRKGLPLIIEALSLLPGQQGKLLVVGRDNIPFYQDMARARGVGDRVVFAGFADDVRAYYAAGDVFVYPSLFEAFALVTLEAAGAGLPIVATRINGTEELIEDGDNGFFVQPDAGDIAAKVGVLIGDPLRRGRMGARAHERARQFSRPEMVRKTQEVYEAVLGGPHG